MEEVPTGLVLLRVEAHHKLDVLDGLALRLPHGLQVGRLRLVERLPCAKLSARRAPDEHVWALLPHDLPGPFLLHGATEVPWLPVDGIVDREIKGKSREDMPESLLAPLELRSDARW